MRWFRWLICASAICLMVACGGSQSVSGEGISIAQMEQTADGIPTRVVASLIIDNGGYGFLLREGRIRISYKGKNVVMLSPIESVKISPRRKQEVEIPLRVSIIHNSSAVAFREALKRGDVSDMKVDWRFDVRVAGIKNRLVELQPTPITELLPAEQIEEICRAVQQSLND